MLYLGSSESLVWSWCCQTRAAAHSRLSPLAVFTKVATRRMTCDASFNCSVHARRLLSGTRLEAAEFVTAIPPSKVCSACGLVRKRTALLPCVHVLCESCYEQCAHGGMYVCPLDGYEWQDEHDVDWKDFPLDQLLQRECYPDVGEWYLTYRNYYYDPYFGGSAKCVKYQRYGTYENFSTPIMLTFPDGEVRGRFSMSSSECYSTKDAVTFVRDDESTQSFHIIYTDCQICSILRHPYAANGYGCSYWRRTSTLHESDDCCKFIYDQNCGTSPMYQMYDRSCQS
uniref:RING-type domain-containing protein n=1 Tax=Amblyomma maculatum TaxID=34609 RepID=G3MSF4_AMBMU